MLSEKQIACGCHLSQPEVLSANRCAAIGATTGGEGGLPPITRRYQVQRILKAANRLRQHYGELKTVYLAPDRSMEERKVHSK